MNYQDFAELIGEGSCGSHWVLNSFLPVSQFLAEAPMELLEVLPSGSRCPAVSMTDETNIVVFTTPDAPGTSGSPVISEDGKILGLVSQRLPKIEANRVLLDRERKPVWLQTAAVSSREIRTFLQHVNQRNSP